MHISDDSDISFKILGERNPYWAVLADGDYRGKELPQAKWDQFFATGEKLVSDLMDTVSKHFNVLNYHRALDFGCGTGRVAIPLASYFREVTGVDISPAMLKEAESNCVKRKVDNAKFVISDDALSCVHGPFDFVHSYIVLQHIPVSRGMKYIERLIDLLAPGGVAALHITYDRNGSILRKISTALRRYFLPFNCLVNLLQKRPWDEPLMQMNHYNLRRLFRLLAAKNISSVQIKLTQHGTHFGLFLFFQKDV